MKILTAVIALLSFSTGTALAASILTSKHNLSTTGTGVHSTNVTQVCVFCHTPHGAYGSATSEGTSGPISAQLVPLWNHATTTASYTMYNSTNNPISNLQGTVDTSPTGASLACLSCHDGTLAIDQYGEKVSGSFTPTAKEVVLAPVEGYAGILTGGNLMNDHPIGFSWATATPDADIQNASSLPLFVNGTLNDSMECATCHDVHGKLVPAKFLRVNNAGSNLCLSCHNK